MVNTVNMIFLVICCNKNLALFIVYLLIMIATGNSKVIRCFLFIVELVLQLWT